MAKIRFWRPDGAERTYIESMPWCWPCHGAVKAKHPERYVARQQAYRDFLLREWDGETMRTCVTCQASFPDVLFPYTAGCGAQTITRRKKCITCRENNVREGIKRGAVTAPVNAFDVTVRWIEQETGRKWERWTQADHEAQCVLMREMTGVPHHAITRITDQEAQWNRRVQDAITQYVPSANSWRAWHMG